MFRGYKKYLIGSARDNQNDINDLVKWGLLTTPKIWNESCLLGWGPPALRYLIANDRFQYREFK